MFPTGRRFAALWKSRLPLAIRRGRLSHRQGPVENLGEWRRVKGQPGGRSPAPPGTGEDWGEAFTLDASKRPMLWGGVRFLPHPCHVASAGFGAAPQGFSSRRREA